MLYIQSYCKIADNKLTLNGIPLLEADKTVSAADFLTLCYREVNANYLKFFKMDNLAKAGFLAADLLLRQSDVATSDLKDNVGIILANSVSSLDIDTIYEQTIASPENYFPSPSSFVYTLANIVMGEICIKYKITGENTFFIAQNIEKAHLDEKVCMAFEQGKMQTVICGWIDFMENSCQTFVMLVQSEETSGCQEFTSENILKLYN